MTGAHALAVGLLCMFAFMCVLSLYTHAPFINHVSFFNHFALIDWFLVQGKGQPHPRSQHQGMPLLYCMVFSLTDRTVLYCTLWCSL